MHTHLVVNPDGIAANACRFQHIMCMRIRSGTIGNANLGTGSSCLKLLLASHKDAVNILGKALTDARTALEQASSEDSQHRFANLSVFMLCVWYLVSACFGFCYASFDFLRETVSTDWDHNDEGHVSEGSNHPNTGIAEAKML